jgi:hypothetical protein
MQRPGVSNEDIAGLEDDRFGFDLAEFDALRGFPPGQAVSTGGDLDRTILELNSGEREADNQKVRRQRQIRRFLKQGPFVVCVELLVRRPLDWNVAAPLVGDEALAERAADDGEHLLIEEESSREARRLEGHREEVAVRSAIGLVAIRCEVLGECGPECLAASFDERPREVGREDTESPLSKFDDFPGELEAVRHLVFRCGRREAIQGYNKSLAHHSQ